jgi:Flp pilus assembly pilin Flp
VYRTIWTFLRKNDLGQDVAEYCLLTALLALVALGIFYHAVGGMDGIWGSVNATLAAGNANNSAGTTTSTAHTPGN